MTPAEQITAARADAHAIPIGIGTAYLDALRDWPSGRPALVVIPHAADEPPPAAIHPSVTVIPFVYRPLSTDACNRSQRLHHDHTRLALALTLSTALAPLCATHSTGTLLAALQIMAPPHDATATPFAREAAALLPTIIAAGCWSAAQQSRYAAFAAVSRTTDVCVVSIPTDQAAVSVFCHHLDSTAHWCPLQLPSRPLAVLGDPDALESAQQNAAALFDTLQRTGAGTVLIRNFSLFLTLEFALCCLPLLTVTRTRLLCAMSDWYTQLGHDFLGGALAPHVRKHLSPQHMQLLTMYPIYGAASSPRDYPSGVLPYHYLADAPLRTPLASRAECDCDILIAHTARNHVRFEILPELVQEWFRGLATLQQQLAPQQHPDTIAHRTLLALHQRLQDPRDPIGAPAVQTLLSDLNFIYYVITRRNAIRDLVPQLTPNFRVLLVGTGWVEACPNVHRRQSVGRDELNTLYQRAGVTLFFSSMHEVGAPPPEAYQCAASGGFPIIAAPTVFPNTPAPWPIDGHRDFAMFTTTERLLAQIRMILDRWPSRNQHLAALHERWTRTLVTPQRFALDALCRAPLSAPSLQIVEAPHLAQAISDMSYGYLAALHGERALAETAWRRASTAAPDLPVPAWHARAVQGIPCASS